jgi:hypothetical protein
MRNERSEDPTPAYRLPLSAEEWAEIQRKARRERAEFLHELYARLGTHLRVALLRIGRRLRKKSSPNRTHVLAERAPQIE